MLRLWDKNVSDSGMQIIGISLSTLKELLLLNNLLATNKKETKHGGYYVCSLFYW